MKTYGIKQFLFSILILVCLAVISIGMAVLALYREHQENKVKIDELQAELDEFGPGTVIEIYSYRTGIKPANYAYVSEVVVVNERRERRIAYRAGKPVVIGDVWSLKVDDDFSFVYLDKLLKASPKKIDN